MRGMLPKKELAFSKSDVGVIKTRYDLNSYVHVCERTVETILHSKRHDKFVILRNKIMITRNQIIFDMSHIGGKVPK
jgi:hypothetical protein